LHWKEMGSFIVFGVILIVLLFHFPTTTKWCLVVGVTVVLAGAQFMVFLANRRNDQISEIAAKLDKSGRPPALPKPMHSSHRPKKNRLMFTISIYGFCILCASAKEILGKGYLTPKADVCLEGAMLMAASIFCGFNLFWGIREKQTWLVGFSSIARETSPANYWVAISGWAFMAGAFSTELIFQICKIVAG